jgi:hypothetical protein
MASILTESHGTEFVLFFVPFLFFLGGGFFFFSFLASKCHGLERALRRALLPFAALEGKQ